jgi:hypothetical protein
VEHEFTPVIRQILKEDFKKQSEDIYKMSLLTQYLNIKTRSASRGSRAGHPLQCKANSGTKTGGRHSPWMT